MRRIALLATTIALLAPAAGAARAGVDVDFGASVRVGDHTDLYFNISSRYFERERPVVDSWGRRFENPDDLAVFLFLVQRSGKTPDAVFALRWKGLTWWEVGARIGVPMDAWFIPVEVDPGPPYGKAYGYWKKHRNQPPKRSSLTDMDARNLVAVRVMHEYYGIPVELAMERRASGRAVSALVVEEYDRRRAEASVSRPGSKKQRGKKPRKDRD